MEVKTGQLILGSLGFHRSAYRSLHSLDQKPKVF
jgi:hypothetical protein